MGGGGVKGEPHPKLLALHKKVFSVNPSIVNSSHAGSFHLVPTVPTSIVSLRDFLQFSSACLVAQSV
jgi:hypothetical protein